MNEQVDKSVKQSGVINIGAMIRWGMGGFLVGLLALVLAVVLFDLHSSISTVWIVLIVFIIAFGVLGARRFKKKGNAQFISNEGLTQNQRIAAWIACLINPVIAGGIMHFMWKNVYPTKARQANGISIIVFLIQSAVAIYWVISAGYF